MAAVREVERAGKACCATAGRRTETQQRGERLISRDLCEVRENKRRKVGHAELSRGNELIHCAPNPPERLVKSSRERLRVGLAVGSEARYGDAQLIAIRVADLVLLLLV